MAPAVVSTAMDLRGEWRAAPADDELRRRYHDSDFDDRLWHAIPVPSHWAASDAFRAAGGPLLFRRQFDATAAKHRRYWLCFDGVFYQGDVWLDGTYLGDTEGYYVPHRFEITDQLAQRREHILALEVASPRNTDPQSKRVLGGCLVDDPQLGSWNPGGIWRPVRITGTGPVAILHARLKCTEATEERGQLTIRLVVDSDSGRKVTFRTRVAGTEHSYEQSVAAGENRVQWSVTVNRPPRWWPHSMGTAALHDVHVSVIVDDDPSLSDERRWRTGFRSVELDNWRLSVNGERLFLKGASIGPAADDLAGLTVSELCADLLEARRCGLDLVRVHTHISRPELYEYADSIGLLLWQDLPLHRRYGRGVRKQALRQAREAVDLLAHHPSIAIWCAHNEPYAVDEHLAPTAARQGYGRGSMMRLLPQQIPSWNRSVLDGSLRVTLDRNDGTRPVVAHSGVGPHIPQLSGTDSHLWFGWYEDQVEAIAQLAATLPRLVRFVSEFGAQSVPAAAEFCEPERWPDLPWERLVNDHGCQTAVFDERVSPDHYATFDEWRVATQEYQALVIRRTIELLRRIKYRPTGGFCLYRLSDARPEIGFSLIDHERREKRALQSLREVCRPVIPVLDPLPDPLRAGTPLDLAVHVVSDLRQPLSDVEVRATITSASGVVRRGWGGDIDADSVACIGQLTFDAPPAGELAVELELRHPELTPVTARYQRFIR